MGIILKDWYGKDHEYDYDRIWIRDTEGGLVPFTKGTGEVTLESLEVTENGIFTPPDGVDGFNQVTVNVEDEVNELLFNKTDFAGFAADDSLDGLYAKTLIFGTDIEALEIILGREYTVSWDGNLYTSVAKDTYRVFEEEDPIDGTTLYRYKYYLGNGSLLGYSDLEDTGESFVIVYQTYSNELVLISTENLDSHNVAIMKRVRPQDGLDMMLQSITVTENGVYTADPIYDGLKQVVVDIAGVGVSDDVRYVTFDNHDGSVEYGKKAVATGDDCADPITRGVFDTPTKESTPQYDFDHDGWANEPNGAADANWNKAIMEDKTVYASFKNVLRYYTITFFDEDGSTVLATKSFAYDSVPSYAPTKDDYDFVGWMPELVAVTGDASYTAKWKQKAAFATASWDEIAEICNSGRASEYFVLGDTKDVVLTHTDGTTETVTFEIVDMNLTEDKGQSLDRTTIGQSSIALLATRALSKPIAYVNSSLGNSDSALYSMSKIGTYLKDLCDCLPTDMATVLKEVGGSFLKSKLNIPTSGNIWGKNYYYHGTSAYPSKPKQQFEVFKNGRTKVCKDASGNNVNWWTSSCEQYGSSIQHRPVYIKTSGELACERYAHSKEYYIRLLCFI